MALDMGHTLTVLLVLLCSSGLQAEEIHNQNNTVRLVGGSRRCTGTLEMRHEGQWRPVYDSDWTLQAAAMICRELDCGSVASTEEKEPKKAYKAIRAYVWWISSDCIESGSPLRDCVRPSTSTKRLEITCSDSVRLVNGTSLCSGRLEVNFDKSNQSWSSVCEEGFDLQDAKLVCWELGCGALSVLQGALYGEAEAPMLTKEFQCGGHEFSLWECKKSDPARNTCSPGKAVGLTCSEPVRLVGGPTHCSGVLEMKYRGEWRPAFDRYWTLKDVDEFCTQLNCGSVSSMDRKKELSDRFIWKFIASCVQSGSALRDCVSPDTSRYIMEVTCLVCEADFDQQDAEVVCRELGCGAPSVLQGALYGEVEAPVWTKEFQCGGNESALLDCRSSDSARNTCSAGKAVGLTCSETDHVRLVGGDSRCSGTVEMKYGGDWRQVHNTQWNLEEADRICRLPDCGSALSVTTRQKSDRLPKWAITTYCVQTGSALRDCARPDTSSTVIEITCSDSVRLVNGTSWCSGRLEVKSNQRWSSVCEADFDQQDAEVVCRELGCGPPSVLQGALYGEVEAPMWTKEFQCGGNESALLDCRSSDSARNTCSPGTPVGLTCSAPVTLVGGDSRCSGVLEMKLQNKRRPVEDMQPDWTLKDATVFCKELDCGSAVSLAMRKWLSKHTWAISSQCVWSGSSPTECARSASFNYILDLQQCFVD